MGVTTAATRRVKNRRRRIRRVSHPKPYSHILVEAPTLIFKTWYLLRPSSDRIIDTLMDRIGGSLKEATQRIKGMMKDLNKKGPRAYASPRLLGLNIGRLKYAINLAYKNERFRKAMKILCTKWRTKHLIKANEEDLITMEPPVKGVYLYDWKERRIYAFEASTALQCLTKRILFHEGMFATALKPVNPYTNVELTLGQIHSLVEQLRGHGIAHWTLESLRNMAYCWNEFLIFHDTPLQLEAMRQVFTDLTGNHLRDTLFDFIDSEYLNHDVPMDKDVYIWAIKHAIDSIHMSQWRKLCYDYYRSQILYKDAPIKHEAVQLKISVNTMALVQQHPREIYNMRAKSAIQITGSDLA